MKNFDKYLHRKKKKKNTKKKNIKFRLKQNNKHDFKNNTNIY